MASFYFSDEFGDVKYIALSGNIKYYIQTNDYSQNRRYHSRHKRYGFKDKAAAIEAILKLASDDYEYAFNGAGQQIYCKNKITGVWWTKTFNKKGRCTELKTSGGVYFSVKLDSDNKIIEYEDSDGNWWSKGVLSTSELLFPPIVFGDCYSFINDDNF